MRAIALSLAVPVALAVAAPACGSSKPPATEKSRAAAPLPSPQARFDAAVETFYWAHLDFRPHTGVELGHHQYDGQLPDNSAAALAAEVKRLRQALATFQAIPADRLSDASRIDREVLLAEIRGELIDLDAILPYANNPMVYLIPLNLVPYISRDYAPLPDRARAIGALCREAPAYLKVAQDNLVPAMPRSFIETALMQVDGMIAFARDDIRRAMSGLDAAAGDELEGGLALCEQALTGFRAFLVERQAQATDAFALGPELFLRMLADKEGIEIDLARLEQIAAADLDRNTRALEEAARAIGKRQPVRKVLAKVNADKPPAKKILAVATDQAAEMRKFLVDKAIVTIPSEDAAEVTESPPFMRWNFAFLDGAGVFETRPLPSFYYISPPDPKWSKAVQRAYIPSRADLLFTTIHELWPGHFLHALHTKRVESRVLKSFCSYSMSEGWAHYTEEMMWEAGVGGGDPRVHIGQLLNALHRNARFLSAIGLHARQMTVEQSAALFVEKGFADEATARQQAVRGTFDPGYLNYTVGKLMIRKLREDWKAKVGEKFSLQAFHDTFLSYGCAPIPVIRRAMLGDDAGPPL
jgi:uncharacterized protein (DUF885 family)